MPKPRQRIATGLSVNDILNMPISKFQTYTPSQQREIVSRLGSAANKRLRTFEKSGIVNSATARLYESGGKISVRGKTGDELTRELLRARNYLNNRFSSKKEWDKTIKNLKKNPDLAKIEKDILSKAFAAYDLARDYDPEIVNKLNKYEMAQEISFNIEYADEYDLATIRDDIIKRARDEFNRRRKEYNDTITRFSDTLENDIPRRMSKKRKRRHR